MENITMLPSDRDDCQALFSVKEIAAQLGKDEKTIYYWIDKLGLEPCEPAKHLGQGKGILPAKYDLHTLTFLREEEEEERNVKKANELKKKHIDCLTEEERAIVATAMIAELSYDKKRALAAQCIDAANKQAGVKLIPGMADALYDALDKAGCVQKYKFWAYAFDEYPEWKEVYPKDGTGDEQKQYRNRRFFSSALDFFLPYNIFNTWRRRLYIY